MASVPTLPVSIVFEKDERANSFKQPKRLVKITVKRREPEHKDSDTTERRAEFLLEDKVQKVKVLNDGTVQRLEETTK